MMSTRSFTIIAAIVLQLESRMLISAAEALLSVAMSEIPWTKVSAGRSPN